MIDVHSDCFTVNYKAGLSSSDVSKLELTLLICPQTRTISGAGEMQLCYHHDLEVGTHIEGSFITTMIANSEHYLITAMGFQKANWPVRSSDAIDVRPNLILNLAIDSQWQSGMVNIKYKQTEQDGRISWIKINHLKLQATSIHKINKALLKQQ